VTLPNRWASQFAALAGWLAAALLLGWWFGGGGWWLAGALALYIVHVLRNVFLLDRVLDGGHERVPLFATRGLWAEIFARVERIRVKARNRKKKYHRLLREVRESTGALSDGGIILNADHEIVWFNPAATRLLGLDPTTDVGNRLDNLLRHPDFVAYLAEPTPEPITVPSPREDAGWLTVQIIPYGKDQRLAIVRDITREVSLERTRRDFVANASHELRSPLTVISGYLDTLADDAEIPPSWKGPVGEMQRQAERMTRILRELIELTRLESADSGAAPEFVDVIAMLKLIAREFQASGNRPSVSLKIEADVALLGSESELHSIFYNIVNNAVRFTPPTGAVQIVWKTEGEAAVFEVLDTGIGIPEEQIPRITERFYRVDPGR
jgi:two-component system, OmpR family, phosphate regulon sensor histidine kinase PhoR